MMLNPVIIAVLAMLNHGTTVAGVVMVVAATIGNVIRRLIAGSSTDCSRGSGWVFGVMVMGGERYTTAKRKRKGSPQREHKVRNEMLVHDAVSKKSYVDEWLV
ncbi:MAG: hypothetical protein DYG96_06275 [Chlorobi bacterium CHB2]|nr:hypothetical protein [Chlorobi bacterium CHB2]